MLVLHCHVSYFRGEMSRKTGTQWHKERRGSLLRCLSSLRLHGHARRKGSVLDPSR